MQDEAIRQVLDFWFSAAELDAPQIDSRMERWFGTDPALDAQILREFAASSSTAARTGRPRA